jgi:hypothetical protein
MEPVDGRTAGASAYRLSCLEHGTIGHVIGLDAATAAAAANRRCQSPSKIASGSSADTT